MKPIVFALALLGFFFSLYGCDNTSTEIEEAPIVDGPQTIEFESYVELDTLFVELGYTQQRWQDGIREVPRVYLSSIPERWRSSTSKTVTVQKKKELFFRLLGPLVLRANELVQAERAWLLEQKGAQLGPRLQAMYKDYRVEEGKFEELLTRVDSVPVSLVLAQAAEESGWGTSRFAALGNALFGQWTFGKGMAPLQRREEKGEYSIAAFESLLDSVMAYMRNINSHPAYQELRRVRAATRHNGRAVSGHELAKTLTSYSERGDDYIHTLHTIMRVNTLGATDSAYLADGAAIVLVPVNPPQ